jgi:hypothetical protein
MYQPEIGTANMFRPIGGRHATSIDLCAFEIEFADPVHIIADILEHWFTEFPIEKKKGTYPEIGK